MYFLKIKTNLLKGILGIFIFTSFSSIALAGNIETLLCNEDGSTDIVTFSEGVEMVGATTDAAFGNLAGNFLTGFTGGVWGAVADAEGGIDDAGARVNMSSLATETRPLVVADYGFNIPCNAIITDIAVTITRRNALTEDVFDGEVRLRLPNFSTSALNQASATPWLQSTVAWETVVYNDATWGETITPEMINDPRFGAWLIVNKPGGAATARPEVDAIEIAICYDINGVAFTQIELAVSKINGTCGEINGQIDITAQNGSGMYEYSIDNGMNWQASPTFSALTPGPYLLTVRNTDLTCQTAAFNCLVGVNETILQPGDAIGTCDPFGSPVTLYIERLATLNTFYTTGFQGSDISDYIESSPMTWNTGDLGGEVFSVTTDDDLNIYTGTTSLYSLNNTAPTILTKIDGITGVASPLATLPGTKGFAGVEWDNTCGQLFAANLEDGIIYRVDGTTGAVLSTFDPLTPDSGVVGFEPIGERILGLGYSPNEGRLYYSVWANDQVNNGERNTIRSIAIDPVSCDFMVGTDVEEIQLPFLSEACGSAADTYSMPISDIEISATGGTILLAESGVNSLNNTKIPHKARILEYDGSTGAWTLDNTPNPNNSNGCKYGVGAFREQNNARGGVDFANGGFDAMGCTTAEEDYMVATVDGVFGVNCIESCVYGVQYVSTVDGGGPAQSVGLDIDRNNNSQLKSIYGDVDMIGGCLVSDPILCVEYDLAISSTLITTGIVEPGDVITVEYTITNQLTEDATNVEITGTLPTGFTHNGSMADPNVTDNLDNTFVIASLPAGETQVITVMINVPTNATAATYDLFAEITLDDGDDIDSDPATNYTVDEDADGDPFDDDEDVVMVLITVLEYDLALTKTLGGMAPYNPGDNVTYTIAVTNEGDIAANNIIVTDIPETGLIFQSMTPSAGVQDNFNGTYTIANIPVGGVIQFDVIYMISATTTATSLDNIARIISDDGDDIDSDPTADETFDEDGDGDPFDDDEDIATVPITILDYDLSLTKTLGGMAPYNPGDNVTFTITVTNDGELDASGIVVTDSSPAGLIFQSMTPAAGVTDNANETFTIASIPVMTAVSFDVVYMISATETATSIDNIALITTDDGMDIDSDPGMDETQDEDGDGDPFDDDEDVVTVPLTILDYDLSLTKTLGGMAPYNPGDNVTFTITVTNEGELDASGVVVTDSSPAGLIFQSMTPSAGVTDNANETFTIASIPVMTAVSFDVVYMISATETASSIDNIALITTDDGMDIDSDPGMDETEDEDGDGDPFDDDEDVVTVPVTVLDYDLSLTKTLGGMAPYRPGDNVTFTITVTNDGELDASGIVVTDSSPAGLIFQSMTPAAGVTDNANETFTIASIPVMTAVSFDVVYMISATETATSIDNIALITTDDGMDIDSDPGMDETEDEDGDGDPFDDDEDVVTVPLTALNYDLSLTKSLGGMAPYNPGDNVSFMITVTNEGELAASNVVVTDDSPASLIFQSMTATTAVVDNGNETFTIASIPVGVSQTFELNYMIDANATGTTIDNVALITTDDGADIDSDPTMDETQDEDGDGDPFDDDEDLATIPLTVLDYDLSLTKTLGGMGPYNPGDNVTFTITVSNDGMLPANNIEVTDNAPASLIYQMMTPVSGVTDNGNETFTITNIPVGGTQSIDLVYMIDANATGATIANVALITADDGNDIDSDPDMDETEDEDGDGDGDDDDEDTSTIPLTPLDYDLALTKTLGGMAPYNTGSNVTFTITVTNEGELDASNVVVTDVAETGLIFQSMTPVSGVTDNLNETFTIASLPIGASASFDVVYQIDTDFTGMMLRNVALITTDDGDDIDSDPALDETQDDNGDGNPLDDDEDFVNVPVTVLEYDLSLTKAVGGMAPYNPGDIITFTLTVSNDGDITANNIVVTEETSADLIYQSMTADANVTDNGDETFTVGSIAAGESQAIEVLYQIDPDFTGMMLTNLALITEDDGNDIDSDPDMDEMQDEDGDGDPDDDDEDEVDVMIVIPPYDLALTKVLNGTGPFFPGDDITFTITVNNEGEGDASGVVVTDESPLDLIFQSMTPTAGVTDNTDETFTIGSVVSGSGVSFDVTYQIDDDFTGTSLINMAQITVDDGDDLDSDPDLDETVDEDGDGNPVDDDEDMEMITVTILDYDLALNKSLLSTGPFIAGDQVTFALTLTNEGDAQANNVVITERNPAELTQVTSTADPNVIDNGDGTFTVLTLAAGMSQVIEVTFLIDPTFLGTSLVNLALITEDDGNDLDSDPDMDEMQDEDGDGDGFDDDEDDFELDITPPDMPGAVGDYVWEDLNGNGTQDSNEPGIGGVKVILHNADGTIIGTDFTDGSGFYEFPVVQPGDYYIEFDVTIEWDVTFPNTNNNDNTDSDVDHSNGFNTTPVFNIAMGENDYSWDAGFFRCVPLGDLVWFDLNENDIWDSVENGVNGMRVNVFKQGFDGQYFLWDYTFTGPNTTTPSDDGYFKFCVPPGTYYLEFVSPPVGLVSAQPNRGFDDEIDSDVTGTFGEGTTGSISLNSGESECSIGSGYYPMGTIGDFVFIDNNQNGIREANEPGLSNVFIEAYNVEGEVVGATSSNSNGEYTMDYLQQEDVYLKFYTSSSYATTAAHVGDDSTDSDIDHSNGFMTTQYINVSAGDHQSNIDAGFVLGTVAVDWVSFDGRNQVTHNALNWTIGTELNTSHYIVERSVGSADNFELIRNENATQNNVEFARYSYDDFEIDRSGVYYYRIKMVGNDGDYNYSDIIAIDVNNTGRLNAQVDVYPNPMVDEFSIELSLSIDHKRVGYQLYNATGKLVRDVESLATGLEAGKHQFMIDVRQLTEGVYNLTVQTENSSFTKKLIILK